MIKSRKSNPLLIIGAIMVILLFLMAILGPFIAPHGLKEQVNIYQVGKNKMAFSPLQPFTYKEFVFGTDKWGYDLFSSLLFGARYTVFTAVGIALLKTITGLAFGLYTGINKRRKYIWEAFENSLSYIPAFLVIYFILLPISYNTSLKPLNLVLIFVVITSVIGFPSIAATIREKTKQIIQAAFIEGATVSGSSTSKIVMNHILPHLKEDVIVLFVLEIVSAITIIGQLALFHIFIGGTIVEFDPLLYHSITKEWAGLVGQARANLWGNQYLLFIPLSFLLYATLSFQLLASGLKKSYYKGYKRDSWL